MLGAAATHVQPPKPASSLRDAGFAALCGSARMRLLLARVCGFVRTFDC